MQPPDFRDLPEWEPRIREAFRTGDLDSKPDPSRSFRPYRAEDNDSYASEVGLTLSKQRGGEEESVWGFPKAAGSMGNLSW